MSKYENEKEDLARVSSKGHESHIEVGEPDNGHANDRETGYNDIDYGFDPAELKKTIRKVDMRLIPILCAMYFVSQCDRTNLGQARAANNKAMEKDLDLLHGNNRYGLITLMFFIPYIILEIPSQIGLRRFGAKWWLGFACISWGLVIFGMGFVHTWTELLGLRIVLGTFESALYPGAAFLISCWYPRRQIATRLAIFYVISQAFAGLSAILSYGISKLHGRGGYSGWRWIFILYGVITVVIGVLALFLVVDFPDKATFLTQEQRDIISTRIQRDRNDAEPDEMTWPKFWSYIIDVKLWLFGYLFGTAGFGIYALSYFMPQILQSIGFTNALSQLLMAPPYVYMIIPAVITAQLADRVPRCRAATMIFGAVSCIVGTALYSQLPNSQKGARYFGIFLACGGVNSNLSLSIGWAQSSIRAQSKRGFASALVVAWGGIGGILSSVSFIQKEAPTYPTGIYLILSMAAFSIPVSMVLAAWFWYQNRRADRGEVVLEGDPNFRYQW